MTREGLNENLIYYYHIAHVSSALKLSILYESTKHVNGAILYVCNFKNAAKLLFPQTKWDFRGCSDTIRLIRKLQVALSFTLINHSWTIEKALYFIV